MRWLSCFFLIWLKLVRPHVDAVNTWHGLLAGFSSQMPAHVARTSDVWLRQVLPDTQVHSLCVYNKYSPRSHR